MLDFTLADALDAENSMPPPEAPGQMPQAPAQPGIGEFTLDDAMAAEKELANPAPDRGWLGDMGASVARGVYGVGETGAKAYEGVGRAAKDFAGIDLPGTQAASDLAQSIGKSRDEAFPLSQASRVEGARNVVSQGVESAATSMTPALAGAAAGTIIGSAVPVVGTAVGAGVGGLIGLFSGVPTFAAAQYADTMRDAEAKGIDPQEAKWTALVNAASEGGTEFFSDVVATATGGTGKVLTAVGRDALKAGISPLLKQGWKPMLKNMGKVFGAETSGELLNSGIKAEANKAAGIDTKGFWDAVAEDAGPVGVASLIFSTIGGGMTYAGRRRIENALTNPDVHPAEREAAVKAVTGQLAGVDPAAAKVWDTSARTALAEGKAIPLDENFIGKDAARQETANASEMVAAAPRVEANPVQDALAAAGLTDKPEWQQAAATFEALTGGQQSVEQAMDQPAAPQQEPGVPGASLAPAVDQAWNDPAQVEARYQQRIADARAQAEQARAAAQSQTEAERAASAAPFPSSVAGMDGLAQPTPVAAETPQALPAQVSAPKVLTAKEQKQADDLTNRIGNLTKLLAVERNPTARARVEETRTGYEVELRNLTGEVAPALNPEEQARADAIRQERVTPPAALPPGQGFGLVGQPQDFSQAEAATMEPFAQEARAAEAMPAGMTAEDSQALDRSQLKSEGDLIRDYQAQALADADARGNELLRYVRGRLDAKSISNYFGTSVTQDLRGRLGNWAFRSEKSGGVPFDVLEAEAKSQGLLAPDENLIDTLQNIRPKSDQINQDASRGIVNGQTEQNGYAAPMGEARQEPAALPSDRMGIPEAEGLAPTNSDGTLTGNGPRYSIPPNLAPVAKRQVNDLVKRIDNLNKMLRIEKNQAARLRAQATIQGYEQQLSEAFGVKPAQAAQTADPGAFAENVARPVVRGQNVAGPAAPAVPAKPAAPKLNAAPADGWKGHTTADVVKAFPKSTVSETDTGHRVDLPNGRVLLIDRAGAIAIDRAAARAGGYTDEQIDRANAAGGAPGVFNMVNGTGVIQLTEAGRGELGHELMHFARVAALTPKQNAALNNIYGKQAKNGEHLEEVISKAYNTWLAKRGPDRSGLFAIIRRFFQNIRQAIAPTAEGVFEKVASGQAWGQKGQQGKAGPQYALAYHGTPKRGIEQFDWEKHQLTGEGAAAFGAGTYFTQTKDVAEDYRKKLNDPTASPRRFFQGQEVQPGTPEYHAGTLLDRSGATLAGVRKEVRGWIANAKPGENVDHYKNVLSALDRAEKKGDFKRKNSQGQLYEVDIPEADELLDWDKPLSQQPAGVREKLKDVINFDDPQVIGDEKNGYGVFLGRTYLFDGPYDDKAGAEHALRSYWRMPEAERLRIVVENTTGADLYKLVSSEKGSPEAASQYLRSIGIPGHRYLDGMSRGKGEGSHNYVIYDDSRAKITKTFYSLAPNGEPSLLNAKQHEQVRTAPFRRWAGNWAYDPSKQVEVVEVDPSSLAGVDIKNADALEKWLTGNLSQEGPVLVESTGSMVGFTNTNIKSSLKRRGVAQRQAYAGLRDLISKSEYFDFEPTDERHAHRVVGQDVYFAAMRIGGESYSVKIKIDVSNRDRNETYKDHKVSAIEIAPVVSRGQFPEGKAPRTSRSEASSGAMSTLPISTLTGGVNPAPATVVLDKNGEPLVVYHGTKIDFAEFKRNKSSRFDKGWFGDGFYFTGSVDLANGYAQREADGSFTRRPASVMPVFVNMKNPYRVDLSKLSYDDSVKFTDQFGGNKGFEAWLKENDYDGVIGYRDPAIAGEGADFWEIVAFSPTQIKSATGNRGTFSPDDPNILKRQGQPNNGIPASSVRDALASTPYSGAEVLNHPGELDDPFLFEQLRRTGNLGARGTYNPRTGKAYVFANNHADLADALQTARDELHHQATFRWAEQQAQTNPKAGPAFKQLNAFMSQVRMVKRSAINEWLDANGYGELKNTNYGAAEWLTHAASKDAPKWHDRYVAAVVEFFRKLGKAVGFDFGMTEAEIRNWNRKVEGMIGQDTGQTEAPEAMYRKATPQATASQPVPAFDDPATESRYREATKGIADQRGIVEKAKEWLGEQKAGFTRHFIHMPNTPEFAEAHEALRQLEAAPTVAKEVAVRNLKKVTGNLSPGAYDLFTRKVILDDLTHEATLGHSLPYGFTPETLAKEKAKIDRAADNTAEVKAALDQRKTIMDDLSGRLVKAGILSADQVKNPAYFRHEVLEYAREWQQSQGSGGALKKPKPGYAKGREGSEKDISANYLEVEYAFQQRALVDLKTAETLEKIKSRYDQKPALEVAAKEANTRALAAMGVSTKGMTEAKRREALGAKYKTWADIIPDGYERFQADKGLVYHTGNGITDKAMLSLMDALQMDEKSFQAQAPEVVLEVLDGIRKQITVGGKKPEMVLPKGMVDTLNNLRPKQEKSFFDQALSKPLGLWKQWVLINPRRVLKYNLNNMAGDIDAVIAGNPQAIKRMPEAIRELRAVMKGGEPTQEYMDAVERGVFDSGLSVQEIPDIARLDAFQNLMAEKSGKNNPMTWLGKGWRGLQDFTQFRENWLRLAAYKDYLARINAGEDMKSIGYGAADPKMVDALSDSRDKAALLARSLVGDYGAVSHYGQGLRNKVIPFYSWMEVNAKRYNQLIMNAFDQGIGQGLKTGGLTAGMLGARASVYLGVRMAAMYMLIGAYNHLLHGDDEEKLSELDRQQLHIILGHDKDGNIHTLKIQGALSDYLGWVGFSDAVSAIKQVQNGRGSYGDVLTAMAKAPVNKIAGGLTPLLKTPLELAMGQSLFPDVFNPRPMQDKGKETARLFSLENEYDAAMSKPTRGYWKSWAQAVDYSRNVGEISYNSTMDLVRDFKESKGIEVAGSSSSPKSRLIREYKLAQRYGDDEAAKRALAKMQAEGVTPDDMEKSLIRSAPLAGIARKDRAEFMARLSPKEQDQIKSAEAWYKDTFLDGDMLKSKYDFHEMQADYNVLHKQERELTKNGQYAAATKLKVENNLHRKGNLIANVDRIKAQRKKAAESRLPADEKARRVANFDARIKEAMDHAMSVVGGN